MQTGGGLEKKVETAWLLAFYGPLLTAKQADVLKMYLEEDLSLSEIAKEQGISRQGVHEALTRASMQLHEIEEKLHMVTRFRATQAGLNEALEALNTGDINKAKQIITALERLGEEEEDGF